MDGCDCGGDKEGDGVGSFLNIADALDRMDKRITLEWQLVLATEQYGKRGRQLLLMDEFEKLSYG